jgi:tetratricopeptide (TPR) repeat protein
MIQYAKAMAMVLVAMLTTGFVATQAKGQQGDGNAAVMATAGGKVVAEFPDKPELLRRIEVWEALARKAEARHADTASLVKIYSGLGTLYEYAAMYPKAEDAVQREVSLLRTGPQDQLADALGHLATLHVAMGESREAEKEQLGALRVRESVRDPVGTALTWNDLADFYVHQRQFKKALEYAQKAMDVLADSPKVSTDARIAVRQSMAYALCGNHECGRAIPLLKEVVAMSKDTYGADSLQVGMANFLLGYISWQNRDMVNAAELMRRGTDRMKVDLGWGHKLYVNAMAEYARFLRQSGEVESAEAAEREVRKAQSVVDAGSFTASTSAFMLGAPR